MNPLWRLSFTFLVLGLTGRSLAQWSNDPKVNLPVCAVAQDQFNPRIAGDGEGGAIVVWLDNRGAGSTKLYAQRVDSAGYTMWSANGLQISSSQDCSDPALISDGEGGAIVVWSDSRVGLSKIYAQHLDALGNQLWAVNGLALTDGADQGGPAIVADGMGGAIVVWFKIGVHDLDITGQRVTHLGTLVWGSSGKLICNHAGHQQYPVLASDMAGGAIACWQDQRAGASNADIYAQRVDSAGIVQWAADGVPVVSDTGNQLPPVVASDGVGGAVMAWVDLRSGVDQAVFAQHLDSTGAALWDADGVLVSDHPHSDDPQIIGDSNGGAFVAWRDYRIIGYPGGLSSVWMQHLGSAGSLLWDAGGISPNGGAEQASPRIIPDGDGGVIMVWAQFGSGDDIRGQHISATGSLAWSSSGVALCTAPKEQFYPMATSDMAGGAIVCWQDGRAGTSNLDIYAQCVRGGGVLALTTIELPSPVSLALPADNAIIEESPLSFIWGQSSPSIDRYWLEIRTDSLSTSDLVDSTVVDTQFVYQPLVGGTGYRWRVKAHNSSGWGAFSPYRMFSTSNPSAVPDQVSLLSPTNMTVTIASAVHLLWRHSEKFVDRYWLEIATDSLFVSSSVDSALVDTTFLTQNLPAPMTYWWRVRAHNQVGWGPFSETNSFSIILTDVANDGGSPEEFALRQNYPNPFNPVTVIRYQLPTASVVTLTVYDMLGRAVSILVDEVKRAGSYAVQFDGSQLASGMYFCRMRAGSFVQTRKLLLLR